MSTSLSQQLAPFLPYLRRYARALAGSQQSGDSYVRACLEALVADPSIINMGDGPKIGLFRLFHELWNGVIAAPSENSNRDSAFEDKAQDRLAALTPDKRQVLLLATLEGFSTAQTALIVSRAEDDVSTLIDEAIAEIDQQTKTRVLIIEDEPMISMDIALIVEGMGHAVTTIARTASEAVAAAQSEAPGLVLADIQLADGSSGIDAVKEILGDMDVPVIFITAFPERLLTGERPEPTYLITKPFDPNTVKAAISQALFFNSTASIAA